MTKRLLIVTQAGNAWPSGWVRALIYRELFQAHDIQVDYISRQSPFLSRILMDRRGRILSRLMDMGLGFILGRINEFYASIRDKFIVQKAKRGYDTIYLQKAGSAKLISALRRFHRGRLVYDLNDAIWLPANESYYGRVKVLDVLRSVDAVTSDNTYGVSFARTFNENTFLVPDAAQVELFDQHRCDVTRSKEHLVLGWVGSPLTLFNLFSIWEALEAVFAAHSEIKLRLLGTGHNQALLPRFEKVRYSCLPYYSQSDMVREVLGMDIGLFPLFNIEESAIRGVLKATIYMGGEAAVIASPRGQVPELIRDGVNGMLASSNQEWIQKLEKLITDHELRRKLASAGLETVRREYSLENSFHPLLQALDL